ncbi:MAG: DUF427 domain-containing protein [Paracoccaceae bacterium]
MTKSQVIENAAWSYETPLEGLESIANHVAFYRSDLVTIEKI